MVTFLYIQIGPQTMQKYASVGSHRQPRHQSSSKQSPLSEEEQVTLAELSQENSRLKKMLKEAQSKRTMVTKECSQLQKALGQLKGENEELRERVEEGNQRCEGEKYRWEELKFLNGQLSSQMQALRADNESLGEKLRYSEEVLQRKYEELEDKTHRRMEQCGKRIKKTMHYLETLSSREIDKTRELLTENLKKAVELLRGRYFQEMNCEGEIEQLMNPLKTMQEEISAKSREASSLKQENLRLLQELGKYRSMEKEQIPMFKEAVERLKKSLAQVRGQLSENEYEKLQLKKRWEEKAKQWEYKYNQAYKESRKLKLEKKIYENKLQELQAEVEEEKERMTAQNHMLKRLYANQQDNSSSRVSSTSGAVWAGSRRVTEKTQQKPHKMLKKNLSGKQLSTHLRVSRESDYQIGGEQQPSENYQPVVGVGEYGEHSEEYGREEETSVLSQENLKQEICRIDEEIMEIQKHITEELDIYP